MASYIEVSVLNPQTCPQTFYPRAGFYRGEDGLHSLRISSEPVTLVACMHGWPPCPVLYLGEPDVPVEAPGLKGSVVICPGIDAELIPIQIGRILGSDYHLDREVPFIATAFNVEVLGGLGAFGHGNDPSTLREMEEIIDRQLVRNPTWTLIKAFARRNNLNPEVEVEPFLEAAWAFRPGKTAMPRILLESALAAQAFQ